MGNRILMRQQTTPSPKASAPIPEAISDVVWKEPSIEDKFYFDAGKAAPVWVDSKGHSNVADELLNVDGFVAGVWHINASEFVFMKWVSEVPIAEYLNVLENADNAIQQISLAATRKVVLKRPRGMLVLKSILKKPASNGKDVLKRPAGNHLTRINDWKVAMILSENTTSAKTDRKNRHSRVWHKTRKMLQQENLNMAELNPIVAEIMSEFY